MNGAMAAASILPGSGAGAKFARTSRSRLVYFHASVLSVGKPSVAKCALASARKAASHGSPAPGRSATAAI